MKAIERYLYETGHNAIELFKRLYKNDWEWLYDEWNKKGVEPHRVRTFCEAELSRLTLQRLRQRR